MIREKEVDNEEHPRKGERTDNDYVECNAKSAHMSSISSQLPVKAAKIPRSGTKRLAHGERVWGE